MAETEILIVDADMAVRDCLACCSNLRTLPYRVRWREDISGFVSAPRQRRILADIGVPDTNGLALQEE
jgi:FixJ family two-component response regulator